MVRRVHLRHGSVMIDPIATLRTIGGTARIVMNQGAVLLLERGDTRGCKCCAFECDDEVTVSVTFCNHTTTLTIPIPGSNSVQDNFGANNESFIIINASISCTACGWLLSILVCAYCEETFFIASDGFDALIPFAESEETPGDGHCPESGEVDLICFGEQFGIPCVTVTTATIA